jgi:hypothetical protein
MHLHALTLPIHNVYKFLLPHCRNIELIKGPKIQKGKSQQDDYDRFYILPVTQYFILNFKVPLRSLNVPH